MAERVKGMRVLWAWLPIGGLLLMLGLTSQGWLESAQLNWANLVVNRSWLSISAVGDPATPLQDGIPDDWVPSIWGGQGRAIHGLDNAQSHGGRRSAHILQTNVRDFAVYGQALVLPASQHIQCAVFSRGAAAFMEVMVGATPIGYANLAASQGWTLTQTSFDSPTAGEDQAAIYLGLGSGGQAWFDDVRCQAATDRSTNLVMNGGFEDDGVVGDPLTWWNSHVSFRQRNLEDLARAAHILAASGPSQARVSRQNVLDMLTGRTELVRARMQAVSAGCVGDDGNAGIWLGLENTLMAQAGSAAFERTAQLAQVLMPDCPQPYEQLANLYRGTLGYEKAAELYQAAIRRSPPGPQRGKYAFDLGELDVTVLGNWDRAIEAASTAEVDTGWESAPWYYGAASIDLGQAWQASGHCAEARAAYQRVLDCQACAARWPDARAALQASLDCPK